MKQILRTGITGALLLLCCAFLTPLSACGTDDGKSVAAGGASSFSPESAAQAGESLGGGFTIRGLDYFAGMDLVEEKSQLNHQLLVDDITLDGSRLKCRVEITREGAEPEEVSFTGHLYHSEITYYQERGAVLCLVDSVTPGWAVDTAFFVREAGEMDLFSAHEDFTGKPMVRFVLHPEEYDGKTIYFEGLLPEEFPVDCLTAAALKARENGAESSEGSSPVAEKDQIHWAENWYSKYGDDDLPFYDMDLPENQ